MTMKPTHLAAVSLLIVGFAPAQTPPKADAVKKVAKPVQVKSATPLPQDKAKQDKNKQGKPPAEVPTKVDPTVQLKIALKNAHAEARFLQEIQTSGGLLSRFKRKRAIAKELVDTFTPKVQGPVPQPKKFIARLMGDAERGTMAKDVIFLVRRVAVRQPEFDAMVSYLGSYPQEEAAADVTSQAIAALVRAHAGEAMYGKDAAKALDAIQEIASKLAKGGSFSELAQAHSDDEKSKGNGGKRGYMLRKDVDKNYAQVAFTLKVGQVSDVVRTAHGYHLIRLLAKKKGPTPDQDRVLTSHILKQVAPTQDA
ncbi:MAG: peptidylprolyl isomerase, partial [Planctomycetota bacterium]|nr:peptidylprolyl isomerase [Planctomycetota bacterium]